MVCVSVFYWFIFLFFYTFVSEEGKKHLLNQLAISSQLFVKTSTLYTENWSLWPRLSVHINVYLHTHQGSGNWVLPAGSRKSTWAAGRSWTSPASVLGDKLWKAGGGCTAGSVSLCCVSQTSLPLSLGRRTCPGNTPAPSRSLEAAANHTNKKENSTQTVKKKVRQEKKREPFGPYCLRWRGQVYSRPRDQTAPPQSSSFSPFASPPASVAMEIRRLCC